MRKENDASETNDHESKTMYTTAEREWYDPLRPAHIVQFVDNAMAEIYDQKSAAGPMYVRGSITRACEEAFRKALRLSENELAKQLADAEEERDGMLILLGSGGGLDMESATRLRRRIAIFKEAFAMTDKVIEESIIKKC